MSAMTIMATAAVMGSAILKAQKISHLWHSSLSSSLSSVMYCLSCYIIGERERVNLVVQLARALHTP